MIVNKKTVSNPKDGKSYKYGEEIKYEITVTMTEMLLYTMLMLVIN